MASAVADLFPGRFAAVCAGGQRDEYNFFGLSYDERFAGSWALCGLSCERNASYVPICFTADPTDTNYPMHERRYLRFANQPTWLPYEGIGHATSEQMSQDAYAWLDRHVGQRPDRFFCLSAGPGLPGAWGVRAVPSAPRDPSDPASYPHFWCAVEGSTVRIDSENASALVLDLGRPARGRGLGLSGEVAVIWNGVEAYRSEAGSVRLEAPTDTGNR